MGSGRSGTLAGSDGRSVRTISTTGGGEGTSIAPHFGGVLSIKSGIAFGFGLISKFAKSTLSAAWNSPAIRSVIRPRRSVVTPLAPIMIDALIVLFCSKEIPRSTVDQLYPLAN